MNSTMLAINNRLAEGIRGMAKKLATGSVSVGEAAQPATTPTKLPSIGHASVKSSKFNWKYRASFGWGIWSEEEMIIED